MDKQKIQGVPKGEERNQGIKNLFEEITTENFHNLVKKIDTSPGSAKSQTR